MKSVNNEKLVILKRLPGFQSSVNYPDFRLKSFDNASCTNIQTLERPSLICAFDEQSSFGHVRRSRFGRFIAPGARYSF